MSFETITKRKDLVQKSADVTRAVGHAVRLAIIKLIDSHKSVSAHIIHQQLNLDQSLVAQHLRILRLADVVFTERKGKEVYYSVNYTLLARAAKFSDDL